MDIETVTAALVSSVGTSLAAARWLSTKLLEHKLAQALASQKAQLDVALETHRAELTKVLEEQAALRAYEWEARKRLYTAIGPLRFQLLLACQQLAGRIASYARKPYRISMNATTA